MCTASWLIRPGGFELYFNRDERNERLRASGPSAGRSGAIRVLAPRDADAGGSWIGVNEHGLALALLNAWDATEAAPAPGARSRGLLVLDLLEARDPADVLGRLEREDLGRYRGFHLLSFAPGSEVVGHRWDGRSLASEPVEAPVSSSSFDADGARSERARQLRALRERHGELEGEHLEHFHRSHEPDRGPYSVCMHRADASTVSATHVVVGGGEARMRYADGPLCRSAFGPPLRLPLAAPAAGALAGRGRGPAR